NVTIQDPDAEMRRLVAGTNFVADSLPPAVLVGLLSDPSPAVRYDALRVYARKRLAAEGCNAVIGATRDSDPHVALQALDLLGNGCGKATNMAAQVLSAEARRLRTTVADTGWHRPAHAFVSLARI